MGTCLGASLTGGNLYKVSSIGAAEAEVLEGYLSRLMGSLAFEQRA